VRPATDCHKCRECGEDWLEALHEGSGLCRNHAVLQGLSHEPYSKVIHHCPICGKANIPAQWHHIAGERQQRSLRMLICLNCHAIITSRQCSGWDPSWKTESHPVRCIVQGTHDVVWLWWQRSGVYWWQWQVAELVHVVWLALLALLDLWGLRGWEALA
jgi:hypothetical protein